MANNTAIRAVLLLLPLACGADFGLTLSRSVRCLAPAGPADGSPLGTTFCSDAPEQKLGIQPLATGRFRLTTNQPGQCLEVPGSSIQTGAPIQTWTCNGSP